jgi:hypothetical protein
MLKVWEKFRTTTICGLSQEKSADHKLKTQVESADIEGSHKISQRKNCFELQTHVYLRL